MILQLLRNCTERSIASMADEMAVHPNTIRFHLDALVHTGRVEQIRRNHRPRPTTGPVPGQPPDGPAGPTNYRLLANILTSYLAATIPPLPQPSWVARGARQWSMAIEAHCTVKTQSITDLTELLADLGFSRNVSRAARDRAPVAALPIP